MRTNPRTGLAALLLLSTTGLLAGCSAEELAMARRACAQNKAACQEMVRQLHEELNGGTTVLEAEALSADEAPEALVAWSKSDSAQKPGGTALQGTDYTYLAVSGGLQKSGGYIIQVNRVLQVESGYRVEATVILPSAGGGVTGALTAPVSYYRVPRLNGPVTFQIGGSISLPNPKPNPVETLTLQVASADAAPAKLQEWVIGQRSLKQPEGKTLTVGGETWIALSGGLRPTGGWQVEIRRTFKENGTWIIEAAVVPPPPGAIVTQAFTTPTAYFKAPAVTGAMEFRWVETPTTDPSGTIQNPADH
jgi:hypothetical protein